jgi:hypothetical protein
VHARHLTLMRVYMPLRGPATARNFPKFLDGLRSHIRSCSLEGPKLSRDKLSLEAGVHHGVLTSWPSAGAARVWLPHTRRRGDDGNGPR